MFIEDSSKLPSSKELRYPMYMVFCAIIPSLGNFCLGWITGSPNIPGLVTHVCENGNAHIENKLLPDCLPMEDALWGFAVASYCIGSLVGAVTGGSIRTRYGSRMTTILNSFGYILNGLLTGCAVNPAMFIIGRIIGGFSCGVTSIATPIYVGEISTIPVRGALSTIYQLMTTFGILLSTIAGLPLSSVPLWRVNYALIAIPGIITLVLMPFCVESPRYLISINKLQEAKISLQKLRPNSDICIELYEIIDSQLGAAAAMKVVSNINVNINDSSQTIETIGYFDIKQEISASNTSIKENGSFELSTPSLPTPPPHYLNDEDKSTHNNTPMNIIQVFKDPFIRRIAFLIMFMHAMQQLDGINAVMYYSTTMFSELFNANISKYLTIVSSFINFISTIVSVVLVDRMGRRGILLISLSGLTLFSLLLSIGYIFNAGPLMVVSIFCFVMMFALGMGSVPWIIISELSPTYASSSIGSLAGIMNWSMSFLVGQCFPLIFNQIHGYSFLIFSGFACLATIVVYFNIPETKGRSIEDIVKDFKAANTKN